ncbi:pyridoxamine 5'-phosphate oxidase family protein [Lacibacter sp. H375]|uniref:pyridoxamine 5'-phosphate oxidase family protein n=1 Tax=Lacibacter sp. H375 TaxID=3133424 RepID=UPI0030C61D3D
MGSEIKDLQQVEASKKIKQMVDDADIGLLTTDLTSLPLKARPMSRQKVDDDGTIWFFSHKDSDKNHDIDKDSRVQLFYSNKGSMEYLSLYGTAEIIQDAAMAKELWSAPAKIWFKDPDDPNLTILKVIPEDGYYWDTKDGKIVSLFKMVVGAVTGKEMDGSIEGKIKS